MYSYTIETDDMEIDYIVTNESFDHAFGRHSCTGFEITKISVYVPALRDWMDVTHLEQFGLIADKLVSKKLQEAA